MTSMLDSYARVAGQDVISQLRQLTEPLQGKSVVHINSTRMGGGVAEILEKLIPLTRELGVNAHWEVITGDAEFYQCTKNIHNALQGVHINIPQQFLNHYEEVNAHNAQRLRPLVRDADFVFVHDPQPAALIRHFDDCKAKWIWRCHIDASHPYRVVWRFLEKFVRQFDASVFSLAQFAQVLPHPKYIIPPSIDPLSDKNIELGSEEISRIYGRFHLDPRSPLVVQVSRFDRFKDPLGVIQAYQMARRFIPNLQLVLAGGGAADDPEAEMVLQQVHAAAAGDDNIKVLVLPPDSHRTINALQRAADIIMQKSTKEGFGLTVTEGLWKGKPVIGGDTGGIRLQVINHHTGFLVNTPQGAALRIRYLLHQPATVREMGEKAKEFVRENFLLTRQLREYLTLMVAMEHGVEDRIDLS